MKKTSTFLFLLLVTIANCQVQDLPIAFSKKGYVLAIDIDQKMIQVDFFTTDKNLGDEEVLRSQVFNLANCELINDKKSKITLNDLRSSDKVQVDGQWFQEKDEYTIQKITLQSKSASDELEGRIDLINGDFAYVDGNKVKLGDGKKIKGDNKTGYKDLEKKSFSEIKEGIYARVTGKYDNSGYFVAKSFTISPDIVTSYDKAAFADDKETYDKIYPMWIEPSNRKTLFGKDIVGLGKITANEAVQDYVNKVGQKLIPNHIKKKLDFIFIVVDNPNLLAYVKANGLAFVCTGLLLNLENEAQLAAVLGHEISHAIYEHQAGISSKKEQKEKNKGFIKTIMNAGTTAVNETLDIKKGIKEEKKETVKTKDQKDIEKEEKKQTKESQENLNEMLSTTLSFKYDRNISDFSIDQEYQADRVGLCLATLAGYDPRQAPIVWKNIYERYGKTTNEKNEVVEKQIDAIKSLQDKEKQYDTNGLINQALTGVLTIKQVDYKAKSIKTHPEEIKRYQALNDLISLYWNNTKLLETTVNNEEEYVQMIRELTKPKHSEKIKEKPQDAPKTSKKNRK
jgi:beta-barrel assembly-enhancing protease